MSGNFKAYGLPFGAGGLSLLLLLLLSGAKTAGLAAGFLPMLPLLLLGFALGFRALLVGIGAALVGALAFLPPDAWIVFALTHAVPTLLLTRKTLLSRVRAESEMKEWYPLGLALTHLALYALGALGLLALLQAGGDGDGLQAMREGMGRSVPDMPQEMQAYALEMLDKWLFLILSASVWLWLLLVWAHAWLAHALLSAFGLAIRPSFRLLPFEPPAYLVVLLVGFAVLTFFGGDTLETLAKAAIFVLLFGHFLLGMALLHRAARRSAFGFVWLCALYMSIALLLWPVVGIACYGLVEHGKTINQRLKSGGRFIG